MELNRVFNVRKSIRNFNGKPVSPQVHGQLIHAANASPVGMGRYDAVHLTVVTNPALLDAIEENTASLFGGERRKFLYNAPELIIVSTAAADNVGYSNAAIIAQDMALAAVDAGVGACHIWGCVIALANNAALVKQLGIPEGFTPACGLAVGEIDTPYAERDIPDDRIRMNIVD